MAAGNRRFFLSGITAAVLSTATKGKAREVGTPIVGGGSSFIRPVMQRWIESMPATLPVSPSYSVLGGGTAQSRVLSGDLDFAATELPMPADKLAVGNMMQVPVAFGVLACVVSIPGMADGQMRLTGGLLAKIYNGTIRTWNDPAIAAANPGVKLPELDIRPVHLGEPSGAVFSTTYAFTQYLLATNADWREKYGATIGKRWAVGSMVTTVDSVVEVLKSLPGGIGYVPLITATGNKITKVQLRNKDGQTVAASVESLRVAVAKVDWTAAPGLVANLIDLPGADVWPLVLPTYALFAQAPQDKVRGDAVRAFIRYVINEGRQSTADCQAASLPDGLRLLVERQLGANA